MWQNSIPYAIFFKCLMIRYRADLPDNVYDPLFKIFKFLNLMVFLNLMEIPTINQAV